MTLSNKPITGNIKGSGYLSAIKFPKLNVYLGKSTQILASGTAYNKTNPDQMPTNIPSYKINTKQQDISQFIKDKQQNILIFLKTYPYWLFKR